MKISNFLAGLAVGAVAAAVVGKKLCHCRASSDVGLAQANETIDSLRSSIDSFTKQLGERIESEQTYAARCDELNAKIESQTAEIEKLKDLCALQEAQNKKLEQRISQG
ncbi:MAG: hypothetical protein MJY87_08875 [Fibrobacter sp.]|nr:hypothetical protein [Fibrobacter sp.]